MSPEGRLHISTAVYNLFKIVFPADVVRRGTAIRSPIVVPIGPVATVTSSHSWCASQMPRPPVSKASGHLGRPQVSRRDARPASLTVHHAEPPASQSTDPALAAGMQHDVGEHLVDREHEALQTLAGQPRGGQPARDLAAEHGDLVPAEPAVEQTPASAGRRAVGLAPAAAPRGRAHAGLTPSATAGQPTLCAPTSSAGCTP